MIKWSTLEPGFTDQDFEANSKHNDQSKPAEHSTKIPSINAPFTQRKRFKHTSSHPQDNIIINSSCPTKGIQTTD